LVSAIATVAGQTTASFNGVIPAPSGFEARTGSLTVQARAENQATTDVFIASLSVSASIAATEARGEVTSAAKTEATLGGSVNVSSAVLIDAGLTTNAANGKQNYADATVHGGAGGAISAGGVLSKGIVGGAVRAKLNGSVTHSSQVTVIADGDNTV